MPKALVNNKETEFTSGMTVLQVCELAGEEIPRFCYHERLKIAGNCRMCLVEVEGGPRKPVASCAMPASDNMKIFTQTPMVKKAREGVMEFLLINHPLDCPICDQGGECDLQDEAYHYGRGSNRYEDYKRGVKDKPLGPLVKTQMTRCIHCTRCIRFLTDVAGSEEMGATGRGEYMEVGTFIENNITSELSGNIIDLCPVGALTSKPYAFKARSWELTKTESIDIMDGCGSNIRIDSRGNEVMRILPKNNDEINEEWLSDLSRFAYDGLLNQRLDRVYVKSEKRLKESSFVEAYKLIKEKVSQLKKEEIAFVAGDLADCESIAVLKTLAEKMGVENIDCRQDGALYDASERGNYLFNTSINQIEESDFCLIIGANPRYDAPILNIRLKRAVAERGLKVHNIGDAISLNYPYNHLGNDAKILNDILDGKVLKDELANAKKPILIIGNDILKRADGLAIFNLAKKIASKFNFVKEGFNGFNLLQKTAARVGALDLGFVPHGKDKDINKIIEGAEKGEIKLIVSLGADELPFERLKNTFIVYIGSHGDKGAINASVILPATAYTEKDATFVNLEGRVQQTKRAVFPLGKAKEDWIIVNELALNLGHNLGFTNLQSVRHKMVQINPIFFELDRFIRAEFKANSSKDEKLTTKKITSSVENFYHTNPIARSSKTMAKCVEELWSIAS